MGSRAKVAIGLGAIIVLLIGLISAATAVTAIAVVGATPDLPDPGVDVAAIEDLTEAVDRSASQASVVLDADGEVLGRFAPEETYLPLAVGDVPPLVEDTLLAAEDSSFREHNGFEPSAIARALVRNVTSGEIEQGGSTLTQQLAKNLFTGEDDSIERKLQELQVAIDLEEHFSKDEILTAYVNSVFLGNGAFGFEAAARTYFDKGAAELTLSEAALLVGVLPAPTARDPRADFDAADRARKHVLERVRATGAASDAEVDAALADPPTVNDRRPVFERFPYYLDYVRRYLLDEQAVDPALLYGGGLRIETTLIPGLQAAAQEAVARHLPPDVSPAAAVAVVDVDSGLVAALVGGRDFDQSAVNLALGSRGGGAGRQAGSSFKPFVLATAFEQGYVPNQEIDAPAEYLPTTVDDPKPVQNFSLTDYGMVDLVEATIRSINTTFVNLTEVVGSDQVRDTAAALGVADLPQEPGPSIGIGAYETSALDMAGAYAGFADDGHRLDPSPVLRVLAPGGDVVLDLRPPARGERARAISTQSARLVTSILEQNVERGTATRARFGRPAAAKTGTSDEYANAWLVGYTPQFSTAVWVGDPAGNIPMREIAGFRTVTGGSIPALIWHDVMLAAHDGLPVLGFARPLPTPPPTKLLPGATTTTTAPSTTTTSTTPSTTTTSTTTTTTRPPRSTTTRRPTTTTAPPTTTTTTTTTAPPPSSTTTTSTTTTTKPSD